MNYLDREQTVWWYYKAPIRKTRPPERSNCFEEVLQQHGIIRADLRCRNCTLCCYCCKGLLHTRSQKSENERAILLPTIMYSFLSPKPLRVYGLPFYPESS